MLGIRPVAYSGETGIILKDVWQTVDNRTTEIYRHKQDGIATFSTIENLSVFYLRGDSLGESGSGQMWFQESIFNLILDKLADGGLIVTDGSGYDFKISDTAEWKPLWQNRQMSAR